MYGGGFGRIEWCWGCQLRELVVFRGTFPHGHQTLQGELTRVSGYDCGCSSNGPLELLRGERHGCHEQDARTTWHSRSVSSTWRRCVSFFVWKGTRDTNNLSVDSVSYLVGGRVSRTSELSSGLTFKEECAMLSYSCCRMLFRVKL